MKKGLLFGSVIMLGAAVTAISVTGSNSDDGYYQPRSSVAESTPYGANGYIEWWKSLRANPATGEVEIEDILKARQEVEQHRQFAKKSSLNISWEEVGPNNFGGRTRAFILDQNNANIIYAGSVSGGLFKSTNGGASWVEMTSTEDNIAISSLAQAPDGTVYFGTGENLYMPYGGTGNTQTPGFVGNGIYKVPNDGSPITHLSSTSPVGIGSPWTSVGKLGVDPNNSQRIYAATVKGLRISNDGGATWINPLLSFGSTANLQSTDLFVTPSGKVWAKVGSDIFFSNTGNDGDYTKMTGAASQWPSKLPQHPERMRIAVSPQDENYVYVVAIGNGGHFDEAYRSTDGGGTWNTIGVKNDFLDPHSDQGNYNNAVTVDPFNKDRVLIGGVDLYEWSAQGGWQQLGRWQTAPPDPFYVHADNHNVVFDPNVQGKIFVTNDGGIFRSTDNGITWTPMVKNYSTIQFYNIGLGPNGIVMGGAQDNGTMVMDPAAPVKGDGRKVLGGDGGYSQISKLNPNVLFAESQHGTVRRSADFGSSFSNFLDLDRMDTRNVYGSSDWSNWIMPFALWEKMDDPNSTDSVRFGTDTVFTNLGFGSGGRTFTGKLRIPEGYTYTKAAVDPANPSGSLIAVPDSSIFLPGSLLIKAGNQTVTTDATGQFQGDGTGKFDITTGDFEVSFNQPVLSEVKAYAQFSLPDSAIIMLESAHNELPIYDTLWNGLAANSEVILQDPIQSIFVMGLRSNYSTIVSNSAQGQLTGANHRGGIWMTREAISEVEGIPQWHHIGNLQNSEKATSIDITDDGDAVWVGTNFGNVYRFSNLINARDSASADIDSLYISNTFQRGSTSIVQRYVTQVGGGGRVVTSISVHPFDKNRVIVTLGNYGQNSYVYYSRNGAGAAPTFTNVQGSLPKHPVYASTFNYNDPEDKEVFVGTEYGIFVTEDIDAPGTAVQWTDANFNMPNVAVMSLRQERTVRYDLKSKTDFEGTIYAGTHGRGVFKTNYSIDYVGLDENKIEDESLSARTQLNVYPNPTTDRVMIDLALNSRSDVEIAIRDMNGRLVKQVSFRKVGVDVPSVEVNVEQLPKGAYLINLTAGKQAISGKFIKQ